MTNRFSWLILASWHLAHESPIRMDSSFALSNLIFFQVFWSELHISIFLLYLLIHVLGRWFLQLGRSGQAMTEHGWYGYTDPSGCGMLLLACHYLRGEKKAKLVSYWKFTVVLYNKGEIIFHYRDILSAV